MEVQAPGSEITINGHRAKIIAVHIYPGSTVRYTLMWWKDGTRIEQVVEAFEITTTCNSFPRKIGFKHDHSR